MKVAIIVAMALNRVIGNQGVMPWAGKLSADMERFVEITRGGWVIMGRKTCESIPKKFWPLQGRKNVVLTRQTTSQWLGGCCEVANSADEVLRHHGEAVPYVLVAHDLDAVLAEIEAVDPNANVFIIGGASVYAQALPLVTRIFCTAIQYEFAGDAVFPEVNQADWELLDDEYHTAEGRNKFDYQFQVYGRAGSAPERIVNPNNARAGSYRENLEAIAASGKCPFCPGGHTLEDPVEQAKVVHSSNHWFIKINSWPFQNAALHFVLMAKQHHVRASELSDEERIDLFNCVGWIAENYPAAVGGVLFMRDGDTDLTGATVVHLHGQYFTPQRGEAVTVRFGPPPRPE